MVVITNIQYEVHDDRGMGYVKYYETPGFWGLPHLGDQPLEGVQEHLVRGTLCRIYLPKWALEQHDLIDDLLKHNVKLQKIRDARGDSSADDELWELSFLVGFVDRVDNPFMMLLEALYATNAALEKEGLDCRQRRRDAEQYLDSAERTLSRLKLAGLWERVKWVFTGVKV